jgi:hypothetical protein
MKIFFFKDNQLENGVYIDGSNSSEISILELTQAENILFVLPNEILQYTYFEHELKNQKNIHASIINNLAKLRINSLNLEVLNCNAAYDFFVIEEGVKQRLKQVFSNFNQKVFITSDLLFFKETFSSNVEYDENVYLDQDNELVKLSLASFNLLNSPTKITKILNKDLLKISNKHFIHHTLNIFDLKNIFSGINTRTPVIASVLLLLSIYVLGVLNINYNYSQIKEMDKTLTSLYSSIYPEDEFSNVDKIINKKLSALRIMEKSSLQKSTEVITYVSQSANIIGTSYSNNLLTIKCLFKNDAEESIFINQQKRLDLIFSIKETETNQLGRVTTLEYEL